MGGGGQSQRGKKSKLSNVRKVLKKKLYHFMPIYTRPERRRKTIGGFETPKDDDIFGSVQEKPQKIRPSLEVSSNRVVPHLWLILGPFGFLSRGGSLFSYFFLFKFVKLSCLSNFFLDSKPNHRLLDYEGRPE